MRPRPVPRPEAHTGGRAVRWVARVLLAAGTLTVVASSAVRPSARQEVAGCGLATVMTGVMVLVLANYLRHGP